MPNCFNLTKIGEQEPTVLQKIDNELWLEFWGSIPEPNDFWYQNWYNIIGMLLACGRSFTEIKEILCGEMRPVIEYLAANYTSCAWAHR
jgi:hypothetical protein